MIKLGQSCLLTRTYLGLPKTQGGFRMCRASSPEIAHMTILSFFSAWQCSVRAWVQLLALSPAILPPPFCCPSLNPRSPAALSLCVSRHWLDAGPGSGPQPVPKPMGIRGGALPGSS